MALAVFDVNPERLKQKEVPSATREVHDKAIVLDQIHKQLKEKLQVCGYTGLLQILNLVPDHCLEKKKF